MHAAVGVHMDFLGQLTLEERCINLAPKQCIEKNGMLHLPDEHSHGPYYRFVYVQRILLKKHI